MGSRKVLILSHVWRPSIGGVETAGWLLAHGLCELGLDVTVVTPGDVGGKYSSEVLPGGPRVLRQAGALRTLICAARSDLVIQNHVSLRTAIYVFLKRRRRGIVAIHYFLGGTERKLGLSARLKKLVATSRQCVVPSQFLKLSENLPRAHVVRNPFDNEVFASGLRGGPSETTRAKSVLFVGRLYPEKGLAQAVRAFLQARDRVAVQDGQDIVLFVAGDGPERREVERSHPSTVASGAIRFLGALEGSELAELMRACAVLLVPSTYDEPFGIVALEGMACGMNVLVSKRGGLPEAVGRFGVHVDPDNEASMANALVAAIHSGTKIDHAEALAEFLSLSAPRAVAARYLEIANMI